MHDEPEDDYMTPEQASEAGWLDPDEAADIRALLSRVDLTKPEMGNRAFAVLVLIDQRINTKPEIERIGRDPTLVWAEFMVGS